MPEREPFFVFAFSHEDIEIQGTVKFDFETPEKRHPNKMADVFGNSQEIRLFFAESIAEFRRRFKIKTHIQSIAQILPEISLK